MLENMGHMPTVAHDGQQALSISESGAFDLIFMDVQMPVMDGLTATRTIRTKERTSGSRIPIIAMTAHAMKGDCERCLEAGMDGYLSKPISSRGIEEILARFFGSEDDHVFPQQQRDAEPSALVWNYARALQRVDGDESLLSELISIFLEECPKHLSNLHKAIDAYEPATIERIAHTLKGELGYLGLDGVSEQAKLLECLGRDHKIDQTTDVFRSLERELLEVAAEMRRTVGQNVPVTGPMDGAFVPNSDEIPTHGQAAFALSQVDGRRNASD